MNTALVKPHAEFFMYKDEVHTLYKGVVYDWINTPICCKDQLQEIVDSDSRLQASFIEMQISGDEALRMLARCRFGAFSQQADLADGQNCPEHFDCGDRGRCRYEGRICNNIMAENGVISQREIQIIKLICADLSDKLIADALGISVNTVITHLVHIREKTCQSTRSGVVAWAARRGIFL